MFIVKYRKIFYSVSIILVAAAIVSLFVWGLNLGIDFKGGSILEAEYSQSRPEASEIQTKLEPLNLGEYSIRPTGANGYILRMRNISEPERQALVKAISFDGTKEVKEKRFDSIGPVLGSEAVRKSFVSIFLVLICIVLFITFAFRKVSEPVSSWKYGIVTIVALAHDVLIPTGVFSILGHYYGFEVDTLFVTAILVILGFSVHDTIVVFDRVRENLKINKDARPRKEFTQIVGESINQTFVRSINTSLTTVLALIVLYFVGADATKHFSLTLIVGIIFGTYSSIFLGSPLLITIQKWQNRGSKK